MIWVPVFGESAAVSKYVVWKVGEPERIIAFVDNFTFLVLHRIYKIFDFELNWKLFFWNFSALGHFFCLWSSKSCLFLFFSYLQKMPAWSRTREMFHSLWLFFKEWGKVCSRFQCDSSFITRLRQCSWQFFGRPSEQYTVFQNWWGGEGCFSYGSVIVAVWRDHNFLFLFIYVYGFPLKNWLRYGATFWAATLRGD